MRLGLNIDHIATIREARKTNYPNPLEAIFIASNAGASQITLHLREDRRHIHDDDLRMIAKTSTLPLNVECGLNHEILSVIFDARPRCITLVPEKEGEITTEGGLDVKTNFKEIQNIIKECKKEEILIALFIDPNSDSLTMSKELDVDAIEIHTGFFSRSYLELYNPNEHNFSCKPSKKELTTNLDNEIKKIQDITIKAREMNIEVHAGHGLNYENMKMFRNIRGIEELNIGHSIISRSIFTGLYVAVKDMLALMNP